MQPLGAGEIQERLVDRQRLDQRRERSISARTSRPTAAYFSMSGGMTAACGQSFSALNIGMAERTP